MTKYTELGLETVKFTNKENETKDITVIPVVTLDESAFAKTKGNERKEKAVWKRFSNTFSKKLDYDDNLELSKDDKEPFKGLEEDQYYFTDPLHLSGLNINLRKELNIGLRYITVDETDSPVVHVFSDDFIKQTEAEKVTKDIDFDDLEPVYTKVVDTLKNLSKSNIAEIEEHERIKKEEAEKEAREEELKKASEDEPSETSEFVENDTYEDENVADENKGKEHRTGKCDEE